MNEQMNFVIQLGTADSQPAVNVLSFFGYKFTVGLEEHNDNHIIYLRCSYGDYCRATDLLKIAGL